AVLRGRHEPGARVLRHAAEFPDIHRAAEGVLYGVFCQREVVDSEDTCQRRDHAPRLASEEMIEGVHHMSSFMTGRTSTAAPASRIGQPFASSAACETSFALINVYPPTRSLASANGPSVTDVPAPTTLPVRSSGCPRSRIWPFSARSWNQATHFCMTF